jgi:hypothetical protein
VAAGEVGAESGSPAHRTEVKGLVGGRHFEWETRRLRTQIEDAAVSR